MEMHENFARMRQEIHPEIEECFLDNKTTQLLNEDNKNDYRETRLINESISKYGIYRPHIKASAITEKRANLEGQ